MIAAVVVGTPELLAVVAMLTAVSLMFGILSRSSGWFDKKVHKIVTTEITEIKASLVEIQKSVKKVDVLERQQLALVGQLDNGVKDRLDNLEEAHERNDIKLDGLATDLAHITGMLELHLNWQGPDRRDEDGS